MQKPRKGYGKRLKPRLRSGLEDRIKEDLEKKGVKYEYESIKYAYTKDTCKNCGAVVNSGIYTPDFIIERNTGVPLILEAKGYMDSPTRTKMQRVKRDNPDQDIRFVFQRDNFIRRGSKTKYSDWCFKNGFQYSIGEEIPKEWLKDAIQK